MKKRHVNVTPFPVNFPSASPNFLNKVIKNVKSSDREKYWTTVTNETLAEFAAVEANFPCIFTVDRREEGKSTREYSTVMLLKLSSLLLVFGRGCEKWSLFQRFKRNSIAFT